MDLLWLLLPLAAASGWYVGRRSFSDGDRDSRQELRSGYFKGINYLLNEQPDKAIEVFIKLLEVDRETVETHLALGNLYRRRGEVDRAIRIHQNLIARPTLSAEQRSEALLELGQDYLSAGLLDRAENLFKELTDNDSYRVQALRQLIDIYEQEKDWEQAIASARRLEKVTGNQLGAVVAHYYCEQAQSLAAQGNVDTALGVLEQAIRAHRSCVRATLLEGDIRAGCADHERALAVFRRVEEQDPDYLPEVVGRMEECFKALGRIDDLQSYFQHLAQTYGSVGATLALSEIEREEHGAREAVRFIANQLRRRASVRGFDKLLQLELMQARDQRPEYLDVLKGLTDELLEDRAAYQCQHCGFPARSLHWQCPSCKHWSSIKRLQGVEDAEGGDAIDAPIGGAAARPASTSVTGGRVIVALDFPGAAPALRLADRLDPGRCRVKVGGELFVRAGPSVIENLHDRGFEVFLDLKFHDIPNTVTGACRAAADLGVWMLNVHAAGGRRMMVAARGALSGRGATPILIAVTTLTSLTARDIREVGIREPTSRLVAKLANLACECGMNGVVCSARDLEPLAEIVPADFIRVTPGIRPQATSAHDQRRVTTPAQALANGAHYLVIGRPITAVDDPLAALASIEREIGVDPVSSTKG